MVDYLCWLGGHFTGSTDRRALVVAAMTAVKAHLEGLLSLLLHGTGDVPGLRDMKHVTVYGIGRRPVETVAPGRLQPRRDRRRPTACDRYRAEQLRLHAPGHDPFFGLMLKQLGISSFIRLSGSHYNTPQEIEQFLEATASMAPAEA